jgi:hypothetical protein
MIAVLWDAPVLNAEVDLSVEMIRTRFLGVAGESPL